MSDRNDIVLRQRLCQVLTWGLTEIQSRLVLPEAKKRIQELANTLEVIPPMLFRPITDDDIELVRFVLRTYLERFPDSPYPYLSAVDEALAVPVA